MVRIRTGDVSSLWRYRYNNLLGRPSFMKRENVRHCFVQSVLLETQHKGTASVGVCAIICITSNVTNQTISETTIKKGRKNKCWHLTWASKTPNPAKIKRRKYFHIPHNVADYEQNKVHDKEGMKTDRLPRKFG